MSIESLGGGCAGQSISHRRIPDNLTWHWAAVSQIELQKRLDAVLTHSDMVKMAPPLTIADKTLQGGLDVLAETADKCAARVKQW